MKTHRAGAAVLLVALAVLFALTACSQNNPDPHSDDPDNEDIHARLKQVTAIIPEEYPSQTAIADGCFVVVHGQLRSDQQLADDFIATAEAGQEASLIIVQYTIEGDPIVINLYFDGTSYYGVEDYTRDVFRGDYDYNEFLYQQLHVFETEEEQLVCLSNDPEMTWERISESLLSSNSEDQLDWRLLYSITK